MAEKVETNWLAVVGRALSYLCLEKAKESTPDKFKTVESKVKFLAKMGLPPKDAAYVAGSTPASVAEMTRPGYGKGGKRGTKKRS